MNDDAMKLFQGMNDDAYSGGISGGDPALP